MNFSASTKRFVICSLASLKTSFTFSSTLAACFDGAGLALGADAFFAGCFFFGAAFFAAFFTVGFFDCAMPKTLVDQKAQKCNPYIFRSLHVIGLHLMITGIYETDLDKLALAVESTQVAKQISVDEQGIGEDLNINIFAWCKNELLVIAQLKNTHKLSPASRLEKIMNGACIMRKGWGIDEYTFIAEGYCSLKPSATKGKDLRALFAQQNSPVRECISFTHVKEHDHSFISVPYTVGVGRIVDFDTPLSYDGSEAMRDLTYPAALKSSLRLEYNGYPEVTDKTAFFGTLAKGLFESGFEVFYRDDV